MEQHGREKETAAWLAHEYGGKDGNNLFIVRAGIPETVELTWSKVQQRIAQLIQSDNFYTERERDNFDDIDPIAIREALAQPLRFVGIWRWRRKRSRSSRRNLLRQRMQNRPTKRAIPSIWTASPLRSLKWGFLTYISAIRRRHIPSSAWKAKNGFPRCCTGTGAMLIYSLRIHRHRGSRSLSLNPSRSIPPRKRTCPTT